jgi:phage major head subunit gpT-like protein
MKITPQWVATFETNSQTLIQDSWARMQKHLIWDRFMDLKQSSTLRELYFWLIESAKISAQGQGGNQRFDDIAGNFFEIDNVNSGVGLRLTKNEIEDNMMANPKGMPALDYAANWARQVGGHGSYWPQDLMFQLIAAGKTTNGYDNVPFFATTHPINPYATGLGNYSNLLSALPIDETNAATLATASSNFGKAIAAVRALKQPNGKPRNLVVKSALCGPDLQKRMFELLDTKYYGSGQGSTENVLSRYGIEPIVATELTEAGVYYLACEMLPGEGGPLIFQQRDPYVLSSYSPDNLAELQRRKEFEWSFDGRNAGAYGHPYLMFRVEP